MNTALDTNPIDSGDDRVTCRTCCHCNIQRGKCLELDSLTPLDLPIRCFDYAPRHGVEDTRAGYERWPNLRKDIESARKLDKEFHKEARSHSKSR